jgi:hypothetical protein
LLLHSRKSSTTLLALTASKSNNIHRTECANVL